jgi:hypothetical protein
MAAQNDVAADARWCRWLEGSDPTTGQVRRQLYADAMARGNHAQARMFADQFAHARATGTLMLRRPTTMPAQDKPFYTRPQIRKYYEAHRRGELTGATWDRLEHDMIAASAEGRIANAVPLAKNFGDGR